MKARKEKHTPASSVCIKTEDYWQNIRQYSMSWETRFSQAKIQEMRNAFGLFDRDGDGTINAKELGAVMKTMGSNPSDDILEVEEHRKQYS